MGYLLGVLTLVVIGTVAYVCYLKNIYNNLHPVTQFTVDVVYRKIRKQKTLGAKINVICKLIKLVRSFSG